MTTLAEGTLVPVPGGVLVQAALPGQAGAGAVIGVVGVSDHVPDLDEECAVHGIQAAGLPTDPGA